MSRREEAMTIAGQRALDAARYRWLRSRDLETVDNGGVFVGKTPDNVVLNFEDCDRAVDAAMMAEKDEMKYHCDCERSEECRSPHECCFMKAEKDTGE